MDIESIIGSDFDNNEYSINNFELLLAFLAIEAEIKQTKRSSKQLANKIDAQKRTNFVDKIFYFIHITLC